MSLRIGETMKIDETKSNFKQTLSIIAQLTILLLLWGIVFLAGYRVDTNGLEIGVGDAYINKSITKGYSPIPDSMKTAKPAGFSLRNLLVVAMCWTWTNLIILCCICAVVGDIGRSLLPGAGEAPSYASGVIRGFFVYLLGLTGQLVLTGTGNGSQDLVILAGSYFRIAGFLSLLSFLVGYNPRLFSRLVERIENMAERSATHSSKEDGNETNPPGKIVKGDIQH